MNFDMSLSEKWERAAALRQQDFDDLQREVAGLEVGRIARFLPDDVRNPERSEKAKAERQAEMLTRLQMMMRDPAYAALYNDTMDKLGEAERATEIALAKALERQRIAVVALADIQARALQLEDGRRVYRDEDGTFRTEHGLSVSDTDMDAIAEQWRPGMPGYYDFVESRDAAQAEAAKVDEISAYQVDVLGAARDRMMDGDAPPDSEELERLNATIEDLMPSDVSAEMESAPTATPPYAPEASKVIVMTPGTGGP